MQDSNRPLIVIVEDEAEISRLVTRYLSNADMEPVTFERCSDALNYLMHNHADLVLLDVSLPDSTGFDLIEDIHENDIEVPVIFVTGMSMEESRLRGFELGCEDYVTKPFSYPELVARVRVALRRTARRITVDVPADLDNNVEPFEFCGATVNPERLEIVLPEGEIIKIGQKELGILSLFSKNKDTVINRKVLIHRIWGPQANVKSRSLDQYIVKIRNLLPSRSLQQKSYIRTVHGVGYIYETTE